jgi:hypothetical protein
MLSLGVSHKPLLKSAFRNSVRDSEVSSGTVLNTKLDLTKFNKNPEDNILRKTAGSSTKSRYRALVERESQASRGKRIGPLNETISIRGSGEAATLLESPLEINPI